VIACDRARIEAMVDTPSAQEATWHHADKTLALVSQLDGQEARRRDDLETVIPTERAAFFPVKVLLAGRV
jgi:hypothetical protein